MTCAGINLRTGEPCHSRGKYLWRSKLYCVSHYVVASKEPFRFRVAMERWVRREVKKEAALRELLAQEDWIKKM